VERGDDLLIDRTTYDAGSGRTQTERISVRDAASVATGSACATFDFNELCGCSWRPAHEITAHGGDGGPFDLSSGA